MLKTDNDALNSTASICIPHFYLQADLLAPWADDVIDIFLEGKSYYIGSKFRHIQRFYFLQRVFVELEASSVYMTFFYSPKCV